MGRKKTAPEFLNPHSFSPEAQCVYDAVQRENREDKGARLFAERAAEAIETYRGGASRPRQPLGKALLYGDTLGGKHFEAAPLKRLFETLASSWLGTLPDGRIPYTYIPCAQFRGSNPYPAIKELLKAPERTQYGFALSVLSQEAIERPHRLATAGKELLPLEAWLAFFKQNAEPRLQHIAPLMKQEIGLLDRQIDAAFTDIEKRYGPFHSVIVFDGVDQASEIFFAEVLLPILRTGMLPMPWGGYTDFSRSFIVMTAQDISGFIPHFGALGFRAGKEETGASRLARFFHVRQQLLQTGLREVVAAVGDELIIIGPRSRESQWMQLRDELEAIRRRLEDHGILVVFTPQFCEWLLEQAKERLKGADGKINGSVWTDVALEDALYRNIRRPLARLANQGKLFLGLTISFEVNDELAAKHSRDALILSLPENHAAQCEKLDAAYLRKALTEEIALSFPDTPVVTWLSQATKALFRIANRRLQRQQRQAGQPPPKDPSP